jgi:hypothetical protein
MLKTCDWDLLMEKKSSMVQQFVSVNERLKTLLGSRPER